MHRLPKHRKSSPLIDCTNTTLGTRSRFGPMFLLLRSNCYIEACINRHHCCHTPMLNSTVHFNKSQLQSYLPYCRLRLRSRCSECVAAWCLVDRFGARNLLHLVHRPLHIARFNGVTLRSSSAHSHHKHLCKYFPSTRWVQFRNGTRSRTVVDQ